MTTHQKTAESNASRHGSGLRTIIGKLRTTKRPPSLDLTENKRISQVQGMLPSQALKSRGRQSKKHEKDGAASGNLAQDTQGFFSKLLGRQNRRNKHPETNGQTQAVPVRIREKRVIAYNGGRPEQIAQVAYDRTVSESSRLGHSRIDAKINSGENKRQSQIYVPTHAARDTSRMPVSHSLKDRYSTLVNEEEARRLSQMLAQLSPPAETDDSRPQSYFSDDYYRDEQRRFTVATLEGSNVDSESSFGVNETGMNNTLQPPPTPTRRRHSRQKRQSHPLAEEYQQISEEPKESSDYQRFVQQALDRDRQESNEMWRAAITRPENKNIPPIHADYLNSSSLQRSGTFGAGKKERSASKKMDDAWKRSSHYSYQSDSRKRRSYNIGGDNDLNYESPSKDLRKKTTGAKRLSDYFKPPRDVITGYEQPDNKRLSRATFR